KLDGYRCNGAPDLIIEIVSPSSRKHDYVTKASLYLNANVREYWIVDPAKQCTTVYHFEEDAAPTIVPFSIPLTVHIFKDLTITVSELIQ
ncbi:Uma2 family endonuclease, partial [uncultured Subdoligranulum sp.]|uniref:Uma2 family endonuclease n=1 Tax=uncultured Subdoligranulum sp. TaxID=512298 RepID=UPI00262EAF82